MDVQIDPPPQNKLPSKRPALLGLGSYISTTIQRLTRGSKCDPSMQLVQRITVESRGTGQGITTEYHARLCSSYIEIKNNFKRKKIS